MKLCLRFGAHNVDPFNPFFVPGLLTFLVLDAHYYHKRATMLATPTLIIDENAALFNNGKSKIGIFGDLEATIEKSILRHVCSI